MTTATTKVKSVEFPTNANGLVTVLLRAELTTEFEKYECGGVGFGIATHLKDGKIPAVTGSLLSVDFDEKGDISEYRINTDTDDMTDLPTHCVACESELQTIYKEGGIEGLLCINIKDCISQSVSPIYRLVEVVTGETEQNIKAFIYQFPETQLTHIGDLKFLMEGDPNTAPRDEKWLNKSAWKIEKEIWNYLNQSKLTARDFWKIGFGIEYDIDPKEFLNNPHDESFSLLLLNLDRVVQLVAFFDHWSVKTYVTKAY